MLKEAKQIQNDMYSNQRLIELHEYDLDKRETLPIREFMHVTNMPQSTWYGACKLHSLIEYCYVDPSSKYQVLHDILTINGKHYVVTSGWNYYDTNRYNI